MAQLLINNFSGGISPSDRIGIEGSYYEGKSVNPYLYIGHLAHAPKPVSIQLSSSASDVIDDKINSMTVDPITGAGRVYFIGGDKLHQAASSNYAFADNAYFPRQINATSTSVGEDVKVYNCNDTSSAATNYLFYSWYNGTDGDVGRATLGVTPTFDDDFLSDSAQSGAKLLKLVPHPMMEWGENGYLYIGNGRSLVSLDGATGSNGTMDATTLQLPNGWVITDLFDAGSYIGITAQYYPASGWSWTAYKSRAAVFFWDGTSDHWNKKVGVSDAEIRAAQSLNGNYYIFGRDIKGHGTIRKYVDGRFKLIQKITTKGDSDNLYKRYVQGYGCVSVWRDMLLFTTSGAEIFLYGSIQPGMPEALVNIGRHELAGVGWAIIADNYGFVFSSKYSTNLYYVSYLPIWNADDPFFLYKSLYYEFPQKIRINDVKVNFQTLVAGADDDVKIEYDYGKTTKTLGSISHSGDGAVESKTFSGKGITCNNFRLILDADDANSTAGILYGHITIDYDFIE